MGINPGMPQQMKGGGSRSGKRRMDGDGDGEERDKKAGEGEELEGGEVERMDGVRV